ncbi:MAG: cytochrome-c peroxidase [Polyangiales bacterium]
MSDRARGALVAASIALFSCRRAPTPAAVVDAAAGVDASPSRPPSEALARAVGGWIATAKANTNAIASAPCDSIADRPRYLALRRNLSALWVWAREGEPMPVESMFGPEIGDDLDSGALGRLDLALGTDCEAARTQAKQLGSGLEVIAFDLTRKSPALLTASRGANKAAYRVGQLLLESGLHLPSDGDAVLADARGLLDAIDVVASALGASTSEPTRVATETIRQTLSTVTSMNDVTARASLVRTTGTLGVSLRALGANSKIQLRAMYTAVGRDPEAIHALRLAARTTAVDDAKAQLGARLFTDERLSSTGHRSCASCHRPDHAFSDGRSTPGSIRDGRPLPRNTPSLLYVSNAAALTWDGRFVEAGAQSLDVLHNLDELGVDDVAMLATVQRDASLVEAFRASFGAAPTTRAIGEAFLAYEARSFAPASSTLDRFARGELESLPTDVAAGLEVFVGKGRCARCHAPPYFGGAPPPDFIHATYGVIGVPTVRDGHVLDPDRGRGLRTHRPLEEHAFRTPTVRDVARTAPYFHNGGYETLEQVVDFYDKGGGKGLGIPLPNQDLDVRPLKLTPEEKRVLLVLLRDGLSDPGT